MWGIRKPRSTRKIIKEREATNINDEIKLNTISKIFNRSLNINMIERYYEIHNYLYIVYNDLNDNIFSNFINCKYFSSYKNNEELSNYILII
jgi:hypothetical protein